MIETLENLALSFISEHNQIPTHVLLNPPDHERILEAQTVTVRNHRGMEFKIGIIVINFVGVSTSCPHPKVPQMIKLESRS